MEWVILILKGICIMLVIGMSYQMMSDKDNTGGDWS
jgi:hypothetical protein